VDAVIQPTCLDGWIRWPSFLFGWMDEGGWRPNLLTKLWLIILNINS
jgi:hypothetical protein